MAKAKAAKNLLGAGDLDRSNEFPVFNSERERLRYMKDKYSKFDIAKAFSLYYNENVNVKNISNENVFNVTTLEIGKVVEATVKDWNGDGTLAFYVPGVKEEIVTNERFEHSNLHFQQYLNSHENKLFIELRETKRGRLIVSVLNAYYKLWRKSIERAIKREDGMHVHINSLTKGGYLCSTPIWQLQNLTGENYTVCCFIPGSQIIMSVETDFDKWVGQDVVCVPQKFGTFRAAAGAKMEDSIICSRKRALQKAGIQNMYEMYTTKKLKDSLGGSTDAMKYTGKVTGIINSNNKTGVFVEINDLYVIGMIPVGADDLVNYVPGEHVNVELTGFDTADGQEPFVIKNDRIVKCSAKPVFRLV